MYMYTVIKVSGSIHNYSSLTLMDPFSGVSILFTVTCIVIMV